MSLFRALMMAESDDYVKDGLVCHFDGINNTGNGHSDTATVWKNLVGSIDGTVLNATWENNCLVFNGTNSDVNLNKIWLPQSNYFTVEIICSVENATNDSYFISQSSNNNKTRSGLYTSLKINELGGTGFGLNNRGASIPQNQIVDTNVLPVKNKITSFVWRKDANNTLYLDSEQKASKPSGNIEQINTRLGHWTTVSTGSLKGRIYVIRIHDRALLDSEITHNYQIDKRRFNL